MLPSFKAVMFDMDGTLLKSMRYWRLTTLELLLAHDIIPTTEQLSRMYTTSSRKLCTEILTQNGIDLPKDAILRELESYMHRHYLHDVCMKPRVNEYLESLKRRGIPMCVGTYAPKAFAADGLRRLGLIDYFEFITDCYENNLTKCDMAFFELVADRMKVSTSELCVFEDSLSSLETASRAGCPTVAILDGTQIHDHERLCALADFVFEDYSQLL